MVSNDADLCPVTNRAKRCAEVSKSLIDGIGKYIPKPVSYSDLSKLIDMSSTILYNEEETMMGKKRTIAINLSDTNTWLRLNVSKINTSLMKGVLSKLECR